MDKLGKVSFEKLGNDKMLDENLTLITKQFRKNGFVILKDIIETEKIKKMHSAFVQDYSSYFIDAKHERALNVGDKRYQISMEIKGEFNSPDIYANPLVLQILSRLLEPKFVISDLTCVVSLPGSKSMHRHTDGTIYNTSPIRNLLPPFAIGVLIPLISFNETNGTTRVWPGSHVSKKTDEMVSEEDFLDLNIDAGSCILMDYRLFHSGNPNQSTQVRPLLCLNYCNPWYLDAGNFKNQCHYYLNDENFMKIPSEHRAMFVRRNLDLSGNYKLLG